LCFHVYWCVFIIISLDFPFIQYLCTWCVFMFLEISPCIHGDFSFSLVRFSFIPVSILCVDHTISWCTTHLDSNILVLVITFLGVVSIPFLNQFMDSNNLVLVFIFPWYIFISRSLATHGLPPSLAMKSVATFCSAEGTFCSALTTC